jgi:hypothetical protein
MTHPKELQAYYEAREGYDTAERRWGNSLPDSDEETIWADHYGCYKVARYNAVKAGYLPETPEFG